MLSLLWFPSANLLQWCQWNSLSQYKNAMSSAYNKVFKKYFGLYVALKSPIVNILTLSMMNIFQFKVLPAGQWSLIEKQVAIGLGT